MREHTALQGNALYGCTYQKGRFIFVKVYVLGEVLTLNQRLGSDHLMFAQDRICIDPDFDRTAPKLPPKRTLINFRHKNEIPPELPEAVQGV